jgi:hypothetical protein
MFKPLLCIFFGHNLVEAGHCPFTNQSYLQCKSCDKMIPEKK